MIIGYDGNTRKLTKLKEIHSSLIICAFVLLITGTLMITGCISRAFLYYPQPLHETRRTFISQSFPNVSEITVESESGGTDIRLHGWYIRKDLENLPTIIYFGGNGEEVSFNVEEFDRRLPANAVLINYRGYGLSDGRPSERKLKHDALRIYEHVIRSFSIDPDHVIAMGRSLGSGVAAYLAAQKDIRKTILVTPYESIRNVACDHFPKILVDLLLQDRYETMEFADRLRNRVLLPAADRDEVVRPQRAEALYRLIPGDKKLIRVENAQHNTIDRYEIYWREIENFIRS